MVIAPPERPLESDGDNYIAERLMRSVFHVEQRRALHRLGDQYLWWDEGRWKVLEEEKLEDLIYARVHGSHVALQVKNGTGSRQMAMTAGKLRSVTRLVGAQCRWEGSLPWWDKGDPKSCIPFEDVVVDVKTGRTVPRDAGWVGQAVVPCKYEAKAQCPLWMKTVEKWGEGDERWVTLLQRIFGYVLLGTRDYQRWFLFQGKVRAGKGVVRDVLGALLGNHQCMLNTSLMDLSDNFGVANLPAARVLFVGESEDLGRAEGERVARLIKNIVGQDPIEVNQKHVRKQAHYRSGAAIILSSNMVPNLPNRNRGLSSKMVVLPFARSWLGQEDLTLKDRLMGELPGIAAWAVRGAADLVRAARPDDWFPEPDEGYNIKVRYDLMANPYSAFMAAHFIEREDGFVPSTYLRAEFRKWVVQHKVPLKVPENHIVAKLLDESGWNVRRGQRKEDGARGLRGITFVHQHRKNAEV